MIQGQQNWSYHHTEHSWPIVHAFMLKDKELDKHAVLKQKLQMVQNVEANNHLRGGIVNIVNDTDTSWMTAMLKLGYKYACVWFEGTWPANTKFNYELSKPFLIKAIRSEQDRLAALEYINWYAKDKILEWVGIIKEILSKTQDEESLRIMSYILEKSGNNTEAAKEAKRLLKEVKEAKKKQ